MNKLFYSCVDSLIPSPLSEQHTVIKQKSDKEGGKITAYGSEEVRAVYTQPWIVRKLKETNGLNGVIFFTATQFMYSGNFNIKIFDLILKNMDLEVHFARENLSFNKKYESDSNQLSNFQYLIAYSQIFLRKEDTLNSIY